MVEGVPEEHIDLEHVQVGFVTRRFLSEDDEFGPCDSILCIAGIAWLYPPFIEQGIRNPFESRIIAAQWFFAQGSSFTAKRQYFEGSGYMNDKEVALARIDAAIWRAKAELDD